MVRSPNHVGLRVAAPAWRCCGCGVAVPTLMRRCSCATGLAYNANDMSQIECMVELRDALWRVLNRVRRKRGRVWLMFGHK